eukprot:17367-Heterococcus_DN1.PRE.2
MHVLRTSIAASGGQQSLEQSLKRSVRIEQSQPLVSSLPLLKIYVQSSELFDTRFGACVPPAPRAAIVGWVCVHLQAFCTTTLTQQQQQQHTALNAHASHVDIKTVDYYDMSTYVYAQELLCQAGQATR